MNLEKELENLVFQTRPKPFILCTIIHAMDTETLPAKCGQKHDLNAFHQFVKVIFGCITDIHD